MSTSIPGALLNTQATDASSVDSLVQDALRVVREHLDMDVAFVSEFENARRTFRYVDAAADNPPIAVGGSDPMDAGYCKRVVDGRLPELILDATELPAAREIPATLALPIGAHVSVPLRLRNGEVYGTFCCFSSRPNLSLNDRDLALVRLFANFTAQLLDKQLCAERERNVVIERITHALEHRAYRMVYQPIFDLTNGSLAGFEALTRFVAEPRRTPDVWFSEAAAVGLGTQLEMAVIETALAEFSHLPARCYLSVNASPQNVVNGALARTLRDAPVERILLEITEHAHVPDYSLFAPALAELRERGMRLAVDDVGAGYASLNHVLQLAPDKIKLDVRLTRDIDKDPKRRALAAALVTFAHQIGATIIAEGVETETELDALRELGATRAQGYLLGGPMPLGEALTMFGSA